VIAGDASDTGEYLQHIRRLAAGDQRIVFTGFVQGRALAELYSNAYVYVLPSDVEGMPLSLLEAMSYGCCCVTSDIPECADVLGGTGLTFHAGDVSSLRAVLGTVLNDHEVVETSGARALVRARTKYGWDSMVKRTVGIYKEIIDSSLQRERRK
jgi:glycosyltransferase involved in cell wall biosynthesis